MRNQVEVGIVVPTLFQRPQYLIECISSIRKSGEVYLLLMGPESKIPEGIRDLVDDFLPEPQLPGLAAKIEFGMTRLPKNLRFITWLGDDDILEEGAMTRAAKALNDDPAVNFVYGACRYINAEGREIGINRSGTWAAYVMDFGPFLIPQPGSLIRRQSFQDGGGLNKDLNLAFDFDMVAKLKKRGRITYLPAVQASYRWHPEALSVRTRRESAREAAKVRLVYSSGISKVFVAAFNPLVRVLTLATGHLISASIGRGARRSRG